MISLPSPLHYDVKMPNFTFCGERKQGTTKFYFSFCRNMVAVVRNSTPGEFAYIWQRKWLGEIKDEDWNNAKSLFKPCFCRRRRRRHPQILIKLCANGHNNFQHCWSNDVGICCVRVCSSAQTDATTPNNSQQHATGCANRRNIWHPTMLRPFARGFTLSDKSYAQSLCKKR